MEVVVTSLLQGQANLTTNFERVWATRTLGMLGRPPQARPEDRVRKETNYNLGPWAKEKKGFCVRYPQYFVNS